MKRMLNSLKVLTLLAALTLPTAISVSAQEEEIIEGCDNWVIVTTPRGTSVCTIRDADDDWCYYSCSAA